MMSSNGNIFLVTGHLCGNSPVPGEFPAQRPVTRSCGLFFDLRLNKRLSKQPRGRWFERPSRALWRHSNGIDYPCLSSWAAPSSNTKSLHKPILTINSMTFSKRLNQSKTKSILFNYGEHFVNKSHQIFTIPPTGHYVNSCIIPTPMYCYVNSCGWA